MIIEHIEQDARSLIEISYALDREKSKRKRKRICDFAKELCWDILRQVKE
ncbi:hypothetical protein HZB88_04865 [archaeon]|nr:hypothetical protein [archaeon]